MDKEWGALMHCELCRYVISNSIIRVINGQFCCNKCYPNAVEIYITEQKLKDFEANRGSHAK